jgi:6-phosphofructokinase 1
MSENIKKIGVMTSGGDCAGLNAVIRAVTLRAEHYDWEIYGILNGTEGLTSRPLKYRKLTAEDFNGPWMRMSGTILGTINKGVPAESLADLTEKFKTGVKELNLDAIAVIGGDGSMRIVSEYCKGAGINMVGIPKTIDNDTPITEHSVGFATARDVCVEALDRLDATAQSHHRVMILEVMGRDAGHIAMHSAIAGGADVCLVPEIPYSLKGIIKTLRNIKKHGRQHSLMVVAEGVKTEDKENIKNISNTYGA